MSDFDEMQLHAEFLKILAHPTRLLILETLSDGEKCVNELHELLDLRQPNVSQHLAALKDKGLVTSHKDGTRRCYHLAKPSLVKTLLGLLQRSYPELDPAELERCRHEGRRKASGRGD